MFLFENLIQRNRLLIASAKGLQQYAGATGDDHQRERCLARKREARSPARDHYGV